MNNFLIIIGIIWVVSTTYLCDDFNEEIKKLIIQEQLDQSDIKTLQDHTDKLAQELNPEFRKAIKEFTEQVKTENRYLESFTKNP